jgi:aryl-alcohol dehydrogenase-like predicted oxidoreductase
MLSLNHVVASGKVLALGISDTPAWVVAKANSYARHHGLHQFSIYQGRWNAARRDLEREIIPMCRDEGMGILPWGVLGSGHFKTEAQREKENTEGRDIKGLSRDVDIQVSKALEKVAKRKGTLLTSVAQAYVFSKTPYVFPILGCRTVEQLKGNIDALSVTLTKEDIEEIEAAAPFDPGFPTDFLYKGRVPETPQDVWLLGIGGTLDFVGEKQSLTSGK